MLPDVTVPRCKWCQKVVFKYFVTSLPTGWLFNLNFCHNPATWCHPAPWGCNNTNKPSHVDLLFIFAALAQAALPFVANKMPHTTSYNAQCFQKPPLLLTLIVPFFCTSTPTGWLFLKNPCSSYHKTFTSNNNVSRPTLHLTTPWCAATPLKCEGRWQRNKGGGSNMTSSDNVNMHQWQNCAHLPEGGDSAITFLMQGEVPSTCNDDAMHAYLVGTWWGNTTHSPCQQQHQTAHTASGWLFFFPFSKHPE